VQNNIIKWNHYKLCKRWRITVIDEAGQVRRKNRTLDPQKETTRCQRVSTQQIKHKTLLVGLIRCPLWRNLPILPFTPFLFWSLPVRWRLFQLSTAINHGQHVVCMPLGALTPFVHLLTSASEPHRPFPSGGSCQLLAHYDCTPAKDLTFNGGEFTPCLTFSHAIRVFSLCPYSFSQLFHDQTNQKKEEGYLATMRNNEKGLRKSFLFFFSRNGDSHPVFNETGTRRKWLFLKRRAFLLLLLLFTYRFASCPSC
jgi:hypothetical protein